MTHKAITESARNQKCTVRLPGICNYNPDTTIFAHISGLRHGHGVGQKTIFGAYCCSSCHDCVDFRARSALTKDYLRAAHLDGAIETLCIILRDTPELWAKFLKD